MITPSEQERIRLIKASLKRCKRKGMNVEIWNDTFFLNIIERILKDIGRKHGE